MNTYVPLKHILFIHSIHLPLSLSPDKRTFLIPGDDMSNINGASSSMKSLISFDSAVATEVGIARSCPPLVSSFSDLMAVLIKSSA